MQPGQTPRLRAATVTLSTLALALICSVATATAATAARRSGDADLSPRLAELAKPSVRSASRVEQAELLGLPVAGPGSLSRDGNRVFVEVRYERGAAAGAAGLRRAGAHVLEVSPRYQTVTVAAKPAELRAIGGSPRVASVTEVLTPIALAATPCFGATTTEGDTQLLAAQARAEFEIDGGGVTVGVLSDSFDQDLSAPTDAAEDVASGDLPGPGNPCEREDGVDVVDDTETKGEDEGRAMAQIVHDIAPGAELVFATAFKKTMLGFADNIRKLAEPAGAGGAEADVIVDDVSYFEEPFFQEGPVGVAVREVTEDGASYFSAAGNNNLRNGGRDIASWEAPAFRDAVSCPAGMPGYAQHCMDFDPGAGVDTTFDLTVEGGETLDVDLQWAQPWEGVTTDLDAYLLSSTGELLKAEENLNVTSTKRPFEFLSWTNPSSAPRTVRLAINRCDSSCDPVSGGDNSSPRLKFVLLQNGGGVTSTEYESSSEGDVVGPTIFGHNGAADAMSLGAIRYSTEAASPGAAPEHFSSRGPVTNYFAPAEGATPAAALGSPQVLAKPDAVATDGGADTFFGSCFLDAWRFFGTSAAAPHAAAVAALQLDAKPTATPAQVSEAQRTGAAAVGSFGPTAVGAGMVDAVAAIEALGVSPSSPGAPVESPPPAISCSGEPESEPEPQPQPEPAPPSSSPNPTSPTPRARDRLAPNTFLRRHPRPILQTESGHARAVFRFGSNEAGVIFLCKFDRAPFRACRRKVVWHAELGRHVLRVKARDVDGNVDPTPVVFRFRVERVG